MYQPPSESARTPTPIPVAILVRVSTAKQETDRQVHDLQEVAKKNCWQVVELIREEISGNSADSDRIGIERAKAGHAQGGESASFLKKGDGFAQGIFGGCGGAADFGADVVWASADGAHKLGATAFNAAIKWGHRIFCNRQKVITNCQLRNFPIPAKKKRGRVGAGHRDR